MRLSVRKDDPGFDISLSTTARVLVNGEDVTHRCFTADEEKGEAHVYRLDENGNPYKDPANPTHAAEEILKGEVKIITEEPDNG